MTLRSFFTRSAAASSITPPATTAQPIRSATHPAKYDRTASDSTLHDGPAGVLVAPGAWISKPGTPLPPIDELTTPPGSRPMSPVHDDIVTDARRDSDATVTAETSVTHAMAGMKVLEDTPKKEKKPSTARSLLNRLLKGSVAVAAAAVPAAAVAVAPVPLAPKTAKADSGLGLNDSPTDEIKPTSVPTPAVKEKERLTPEQKHAKALAERERRLQEVLSVLEGRKVLPAGMQDLVFHNFIGDGTYGFVVTAFRGEQEVAVKFIFKDKIPATAWMHDPDLGAVPSEIYFLKNLRHPNLIKFLGCYSDAQYMMLVTELHGTSWDAANPELQGRYLEGLRPIPRAQRVGDEGKGDLNTLASLNAAQRERLRPRVSCDLFECIDAHEYFPERVVRHIFKQIVDVVGYLHSQGVVHRDLKDENITIDANYTVKLIDFGSAAFIPKASQQWFDRFLGTMDFAAPEIVEGFRYRGPEVEIWALGVLLYILVFRQVPFKSQDEIPRAKPNLPAGLAEWYAGTHDLYDLIKWTLAPNKDDRPSIQQVRQHRWMSLMS
ncbi:hypothetical protein GGF31_007083 [Allomyces arbusculus]|nr:hypothetical protein GGF31_007083 [Allomyces arbusculus]